MAAVQPDMTRLQEHVPREREPYRTPEQYAKETLNPMEHHWGMSQASVLISITGAAAPVLRQHLARARLL